MLLTVHPVLRMKKTEHIMNEDNAEMYSREGTMKYKSKNKIDYRTVINSR